MRLRLNLEESLFLDTENQKNKEHVISDEVKIDESTDSSKSQVSAKSDADVNDASFDESVVVEDLANVDGDDSSSSNLDFSNIPFGVGKKVGMTRIFDKNGRDYPATVVEVLPIYVTQLKTEDNDGYSSIQVGFDQIPDVKVTKPQRGHLNKSGTNGLRSFKEFKVKGDLGLKLGDRIDSQAFQLGDIVNITGVSKGRGFSGHMKRHGFGGGRRSHGKNSVMRKAGSIGAGSDPSRVWPGTRMAGRYGTDTVTIKNLEVIRVENKPGIIFVKGSIAGSNNSTVFIVK